MPSDHLPLLMVGLGNPGEAYRFTRHNAGFLWIDALQKQLAFPDFQIKKKGEQSEGIYHQRRMILLKPLTFMNLSGSAVVPIQHFYKLPMQSIVVIYDDLELPLGSYKIQQGGSPKGHNGLRHIESTVGKETWRLRLGIGRPENREQVADYVLSRFSAEELKMMDAVIARTVDGFLAGSLLFWTT